MDLFPQRGPALLRRVEVGVAVLYRIRVPVPRIARVIDPLSDRDGLEVALHDGNALRLAVDQFHRRSISPYATLTAG